MAAVLDTNVLFAALVSDGLCREIVRRIAGIRGLVLSEAILEELETVGLRKLPGDARVARFLLDLRGFATIVTPVRLPARASRDETDDVVIATAVAAKASHLVSGDKDLLILERHGRIQIVSPRTYVAWLDTKAVRHR